MNWTLNRVGLISAATVRIAVVLSIFCQATAYSSKCIGQTQLVTPTSSFSARLIGGQNVIVGAADGIEGTQWQSGILEIKEGTSDRAILEYDLRGRSKATSVVLNLELSNLDVPAFTPIHMYSFEGNGLANASDYFRTDHLITTFTDNGLASNFIPPYHIPYAFDLTTIYNEAITNNDEFLGILLRNSNTGPMFARYFLTTFGGLPKLTVMTVPEPTSGGIFLVAAIMGFVGSVGQRCR